ncbi:MAG: hypothetical protein JW832_15115, partial [Deltaproteobacteria bacterium]|nr:hypothetical protein [Deltaproteobacteria bacterium]
FDKKTGYLGVRFQIDEATHYGWVKYQGDNSTDNGTTVSGRIVEWAYEDAPFEPIYVDAEPPAPPCTLALTPGRINKLTSLIMPVTGIIIRGNESANFTRESEISWGTDTIRTLFKLRLSSKTILALVRVKPLLLQGDDSFEVTVDDCTGELGVVTLR